MTPIIDVERSDDAPAIDAVIRRAFHEHLGVADMVTAIRASAQYERGLTLVARQANQVVGFVMISHAELVDDEGERHDVLTLSPLAVHPDHERHGIGSALVRAVLSLADARFDLPRLVTLEAAHCSTDVSASSSHPTTASSLTCPIGRRPRPLRFTA